ncbi:putative endoplasmic reticulum membrane protein c16e8.02, partial [Globisporangium splendens]
MGRISDRFNLEKQVTFYMSYHDNKTNQLIHFACIWPIFITGVMILAQTAPFMEQPAFLAGLPYSQYMVMNYSAAMAVLYMVWYMALDIFAGTIGAAMIFCIYVFANYFEKAAPELYGVPAWQIALPIHVVAWILQFIGHGVFERRKPALLDSLDQALITAPMFVLLEALFPLGYRPKLYERVMKQVKINVKNFHSANKTL